MKDRFSIGEFSKLAIIPTKTLRYYDEIGLFKPIEIDPNTGYRYYSLEQLEPLDMIKYLRFLGVSLSDIQEHFERRKIQGFLQLLRNQAARTEQTIQDLQAKKVRFEKRIQEIEEALDMEKIGIPYTRHFGQQLIFRLEGSISNTRQDIEFSLRRLSRLVPEKKQFFIGMGKVGCEISQGNLRRRQFGSYDAIYVLLDEEIHDSAHVQILPEAECACVFYRGGFMDAARYYPSLLRYMDEQGYEIAGDSHERIRIDPFMTQEQEHLLREIRIPIRRRMVCDAGTQHAARGAAG